MILDKIKIRNFMSVKQAELKLDGSGLVLVQGINDDDAAFDSNGAGKSTVFEAITYALFEQTVRGLKTDEIINEDTKRNCQVELTLIDGNDTYTVTRNRKHKEHKNATLIFKGSKNVTPKSGKDSNTLIERLIGMDFNTFTNSILFGQGVVKMFSTATDREKKEILERMLNMDVFTKAQEIAKERVKDIENSMLADTREKNKLDLTIENHGSNIKYFNDLQKTHKQETQAKIDKLKSEKTELESELAEKSYSSAYHEAIRKVDVEIEKLTERSKEIETAMAAEAELKNRINTLTHKEQSESYNNERLLKELRNLKKKLDKLEGGVGSECPSCGSPITEKSIESASSELLDEMNDVLSNIKVSESNLGVLGGRLDEAREDLAALPDFSQETTKLRTQGDVLVNQRAELNSEVKVLEREIANIKNQIAGLDKHIEEATGDLTKGYSETIKDLEASLAKDKESLAVVVERLSEWQSKLKELKFWVDGFGNSGIKSYLLDSVTPFLNKKANHYLSKLSGNTTEIEFSTQTRLKNGEVRDKFEVRINNKVGGTSYSSNSTGERKRIDLAISLALQDLVMTRSEGKLNVLLYDEVFDGLDAVGCENAIQLLQEIQEGVPSVFVITHNDVLKSYFENTLTVTKRDGETKLSEIR